MSATLTAPPVTAAAVFDTDDDAAAAGGMCEEGFDGTPFEPARFGVEKHHAMIISGEFSEDDAAEQLEGIVVPDRTIHREHDSVPFVLDGNEIFRIPGAVLLP